MNNHNLFHEMLFFVLREQLTSIHREPFDKAYDIECEGRLNDYADSCELNCIHCESAEHIE